MHEKKKKRKYTYCKKIKKRSGDNLSVEHFFTCPALKSIRRDLKISTSIKQALRNNSDNITTILLYLQSTQFNKHR